MRSLFAAALLVSALAVTGCAGPVAPSGPSAEPGIVVSSPTIRDGAPLPVRYTCQGSGETPRLRWSGVPAGTGALAVTLVDPDAPSGHYTHWAVFNLPPTADELSGAAMPAPARRATNSAGSLGYTPPCPPSGTHHYEFSVLALRAPLPLPDGATADTVLAALAADSTSRGVLTATVTH